MSTKIKIQINRATAHDSPHFAPTSATLTSAFPRVHLSNPNETNLKDSRESRSIHTGKPNYPAQLSPSSLNALLAKDALSVEKVLPAMRTRTYTENSEREVEKAVKRDTCEPLPPPPAEIQNYTPHTHNSAREFSRALQRVRTLPRLRNEFRARRPKKTFSVCTPTHARVPAPYIYTPFVRL